MQKSFNFVFSKRCVICYFIICSLFFGSILRIFSIENQNLEEVRLAQTRYKLDLGYTRGTIYDCNMRRLTNQTTKILAAIIPNERSKKILSSVLGKEEFKSLEPFFKIGKPFLYELDEKIESESIFCFEISQNNQNEITHIIGYSDSENNGVCGLEKAYNHILKGEKGAVYYECNALGSTLEGIKPELDYNSSLVASGIVSTIDINIQKFAEAEAKNLTSGAIIVADSKTNKIRAMASYPTYNIKNLAEYLNRKDSPFLNRALESYNVGSVFKPCVALSGVKNSLDNYLYTCKGECEIDSRIYHCHEKKGHSLIDLRLALTHSCNTYFYNFAIKTGGINIYDTASSLKFGQSLKLCEGIASAKGNLPEKAVFKNNSALPNLSIGQGALLLSPVSLLTLYSAIANGGEYYVPSLIEGTLQNGKLERYDTGFPTRVMTANEALKMKEYLLSVVEEGTGKKAKNNAFKSAGKTSTAQTGKWENGYEICRGWFCGFFPFDNPEYTIIILTEDIKKSKLTPSEIFANLSEKIYSYIH